MKKILLMIVLLTLLLGCSKQKKNSQQFEELNLDQEKYDISEEVQKDSIIIEEKQEIPEKGVSKKYTGPKNYELQLMSLTDHTKALQQLQLLKKGDYNVKIIESYKNNQLFYRIRISNLLTSEEATDLGEELKTKYPSIKNYWIEKVK